MPDYPIIPCSLSREWLNVINEYSEELKAAAHTIGTHGLDRDTFETSGLFRSAIEHIRGRQSATTAEKYEFIHTILTYLRDRGLIQSYTYAGSGERHDFQVNFENGRVCVIEAKGSLDGNNTNIYLRPPNADEFIIWSLCQNPGSDPRKNAWSGIHTRLGAELITGGERKKVDGLVIWHNLCCDPRNLCPKLQIEPERFTMLSGNRLPPPCIYLFPRTIPHPRNNPDPPTWSLRDIRFLDLIATEFHAREEEVINVKIEALMVGTDIKRRTTCTAGRHQLHQSGWTTIKRAR